MKISPLLAALGGGAVGLGLSGGGGGGGAMALSPLLALMMQHKHQGQGSPPVMSPGPVQAPTGAGAQATPPINGAPVMPQLGGPSLAKTAAQLPQVPSPGMDPAKRQQIAQMLLSFGGQMGGFRPQSY
jgi:hypothetical protein